MAGPFDWLKKRVKTYGEMFSDPLNAPSIPHAAVDVLKDIGLGTAGAVGAGVAAPFVPPLTLAGLAAGGLSKAGKGGGSGKTAADPTQQQAAAAQQPYIFDPLSMQSLFGTTIAPYLNQVAQGYSDQIAKYGSAMNAALAQPMDPNIRAAFQAAVPQEQAQMMNVNKALQGLAIAQPQFDMLLNQLNQARQAALSGARTIASSAALSSIPGFGTVAPTKNVTITPAQAALARLYAGVGP
jgi:hypothetical protein